MRLKNLQIARKYIPDWFQKTYKLQENTFPIGFARLRRRFHPIRKLLKEKIQTETPNDRRQNYINNCPRLQFFFVSDLKKIH